MILLDIVRDKGIRLMIDPVVVNDHHTKWKEQVQEGDEWKYQDFESN